MPILYPSQAPISTAQLSKIFPWQHTYASRFMLGIIPITVAIIIIEGFLLFGYEISQTNVIVTIIGILAAVVFSASRYGIYSGVVSSILASIYLAYLYSAPDKLFQLDSETALSVVLVSALFIGLALATGYLRDRIEQTLLDEQLARALAEVQQDRLEAILDQLPLGVIISDAKTKDVIYTNSHGRKMFRAKDLPKLAQDSRDDSLHVLDETVMPRQNNKVIKKVLQYENGLGRTMFLRATTAPIHDRQGEVVSIVSTYLDITQQKEIEQRKDDFISIASHELKTPVTSLKIYMQLLSRQTLIKTNAEVGEIVTKANNQIAKLTRLMTGLLDVSQIQSGKNDYHPRRVSLNNLVREVVNNIKPSTQHKITVKGKISHSVWADAEKIGQVVTNLLTNAIKYSPKGSSIIIQLSSTEKESLISIIDTGPGIRPSDQYRIFERFHQLKKAENSSYSGLGMGLYISKGIVEDHGGRIWVESEEGRGSTFTFSLPYPSES